MSFGISIIATFAVGAMAPAGVQATPIDASPEVREYLEAPLAWIFKEHFAVSDDPVLGLSMLQLTPGASSTHFSVTAIHNPQSLGPVNLTPQQVSSLVIGSGDLDIGDAAPLDVSLASYLADYDGDGVDDPIQLTVTRTAVSGTLMAGSKSTVVVGLLVHVEMYAPVTSALLVESRTLVVFEIPETNPIVVNPAAVGAIMVEQLRQEALPDFATTDCICALPEACCDCFDAVDWCSPNGHLRQSWDLFRACKESCFQNLYPAFVGGAALACWVPCVAVPGIGCTVCLAISGGIFVHQLIACEEACAADYRGDTAPVIYHLNKCLMRAGCDTIDFRSWGPYSRPAYP